MRHTKTDKKPHGGIFYAIRNILITLVTGAVLYYLWLPALNVKNPGCYLFLLVLLGEFALLQAMSQAGLNWAQPHVDIPGPRNLPWAVKIPLLLGALMIAVAVVGEVVSMVPFRAKSYANLLTVQSGDFTADVEQISFDQIPMLDKDSAEKLGDRKLGELSDMVSQFEVNSAYSQINYQNRPVRVTYLDYGDVIKWMTNRAEGLPAYIFIDMVTQEVTVKRLETGMKYSPSDMFSRDLMRYLRFGYPTLMFDDVNFEIDEDGNPYWICSVVDKKIGLFGGTDVTGAVILNAVTGESRYYDVGSVPTWVDRVYPADMIVSQYDDHGKYSGGFLNSMFGQKNVTVTTAGYNYIARGDDVWLYTGITSVTGDESNVGFILSNQRTKETVYYPIAGAEEYSAMASAEGMVQNLKYTATFPLLLNVSGQPTYFMALKDASNLVKMYAMVNVQQYQIVATGSTLQETKLSYDGMLLQNGIETAGGDSDASALTVTGTVSEVRSQVVSGNTIYYFLLDGTWYKVSAADCENAVLVDKKSKITLVLSGQTDGEIPEANKLTIEN